MSTIVVGGGLMGLTTAEVLLERGESVTVLELLDGVALETSYANGGMLTPSMPEPWNGPGVLRHLASSLFDPRSPMKLRLRAIPSLTGWGLRFLQHSSQRHHDAACAANYLLASYSLAETRAITARLKLEYCHASHGTLSVFRSREVFEAKEAVCRIAGGLGMRYAVLSAEQIVRLVPALADIRNSIYCGIHYLDDDHGDARMFCDALAGRFRAQGGRIETGVRVTRVAAEGGRVVGVDTDRGRIDARRVVVAAGTASPALLQTVGVHLPVKPVKGYSVTVDAAGIDGLPTLPVIDDFKHAGITPLGTRLRMVGTAEFTGFDKRPNRVRTDNLYDLLVTTMPAIAARLDRSRADAWAGLRPVSYDGKPFIDACGPDGLWVNAGHGPLGWTLAMGSALLLADRIDGRPPAVRHEPFVLDRRLRHAAD
ncbi:MAG: FAD-dependent oxidoreductase [Gammaproteobacteria bacterium]|nr:FAD-dependent oxidoreductase [Gammaproteobacteria bacterium]MDH4253424.1 FAD-dependent oxidoreductase [Gammaproteobacteria bacterium]MDH5309213.1 FAD-dependent oxidoreductase [Gammaproteobacteria bacterium]